MLSDYAELYRETYLWEVEDTATALYLRPRGPVAVVIIGALLGAEVNSELHRAGTPCPTICLPTSPMRHAFVTALYAARPDDVLPPPGVTMVTGWRRVTLPPSHVGTGRAMWLTEPHPAREPVLCQQVLAVARRVLRRR
ncbi:hypothetical protein [Herbihabitans rhizosphaerae]|uniref:hypothetical protein n=1 Tax=Herbihabitans rhizosphaerae TaxID=1872711 RepID=UPI001A915288|nr:hypothetical protein [Herbihabitans rhizosphaerae]